MTILQSSAKATGSSATEGQVKSFLTNLRTFIADLLGGDSDDHKAAHAALKTPMHGSSVKTTSYTVVGADLGKVIECNGTFTVNLAAAASLGAGFQCAVWNRGSGSITIDPNLSETIDGDISKVIAAGKFAMIYCNGSAFGTVGAGFSMGDLLAVDGHGSGLDADTLDGYHASAFSLSHSHPYAPTTAIVSIGNAVYNPGGGQRCLATRADGSTFYFVTEYPITG